MGDIDPCLMVSTGFLPAGELLESLILVSNEVTLIETIPFVQMKNVTTMVRRIRLLSSLFEEIQEIDKPLPPSSILCLAELNSLSLLNLTADTREQVELLHKQAKRVQLFVDPDEYRCPISLELMNDPVIVASGHTYDRNSIAQWINSGHHTCPKSGQRLIHMALIPNYALKSLIHQWCQENNIPMESASSSSDTDQTSNKRRSSETTIDHISATKAAVDAVKMTAEFLVGKLATGSADIQRQAAYEIRLLAKTGMDNRRIIAEAGSIPFLVTLLGSQDSRIQENAITALLNLSIYENNKILIMQAGSIDNIVDILYSGITMEAKENAAATIFSLTIIDEHKITIGSHPRAIPGLVGLLGEGTTSGKRDAATALFNLALFNVNRVNVALAGAVPLLINLLTDDKAGITDDVLAVLALLLGCTEGLEEMRKSRVLVPLLIDLMRFGSSNGKENSITLLLGLCKDGGEDVARRLLINPRSIPSLQNLAAEGSLKARRKADALLRILNRHCTQITNPL